MDLSLLSDFITETTEHLEEMETCLLQLEKNQNDREALDNVFRTAHSIKGNAEYIGISGMSALSHNLENLLEILRRSPDQLNVQVIEVLFQVKDRLAQLLSDLSKNQTEKAPIDDLLKALDSVLTGPSDSDCPIAPEKNDGSEESLTTELRQLLVETARNDVQEESRLRMVDILNTLLSGCDDEEARLVYTRLQDQAQNMLFSDDAGDMLAELNRHLDAQVREPQDAGSQEESDAFTYVDEADEELFVIYIEHLKENLILINEITEEIKKTGAYAELLSQSAETLESLKSSANYMDYRRLVRIYDKWAAEVEVFREDLLLAENDTFHTFLDKGIPDYVSTVISFFPQCAKELKTLASLPRSQTLKQEEQEVINISPDEYPDPVFSEKPAEAAADIPSESSAFSYTEADNETYRDEDDTDIKPEIMTSPDESDRVLKQSIRVDSRKIDVLMNQAGELVVSRAGFAQLFNDMMAFQHEVQDSGGMSSRDMKSLKGLIFQLNESIMSLGRVANELQDGVMKVRMLPISRLFNRYPRLVRDLVHGKDKEIRLDISGEETELDKMVIEAIADPVVHIIRNAIDHGAETVAERVEAGKPEACVLKLDAYHESNHVVVEILDDGRGIDPDRIKAAAIKNLSMTQDELGRLSRRELIELITLPGFSTSETVTTTSGRGVGMDVVKSNIEKLNGTLDIDSIKGQGTRIRIKIPLTLAIIKALLVKTGAETFTIPLTAVEETLQIFENEISTIEGVEVFKLRDSILPLLRLSELLNIKSRANGNDSAYVVVVNTGSKQTGLVVDELLGQEETVIKPLVDYLQENSGFSGATILGDGSISLILDIYELINLSLISKTGRRKMSAMGIAGSEEGYSGESGRTLH